MKKTGIVSALMMLLLMCACGKTATTSGTSVVRPQVITPQGSQQTAQGQDDEDADDGICDIERVLTGAEFCSVIDGDVIPIAVAYGLGGEGGYISSVSMDPDTINAFVEAFRDLKLESTITDKDEMGYVADGGEDIIFGLEDGRQINIQLDGRTRIHADGVVFVMGNTHKLGELCVMMQEMAYLNNDGGVPGDGYIAVIHGGVGEITFETYVYETEQGYKYINVESVTESWGSPRWNHEVVKIGTADTKEEILDIAKEHGADSFVTFPEDTSAHPLTDL